MIELSVGALIRRAFREFLLRNGLRFDEVKGLSNSTFFVYGSAGDIKMVRRAIKEFKES